MTRFIDDHREQFGVTPICEIRDCAFRDPAGNLVRMQEQD